MRHAHVQKYLAVGDAAASRSILVDDVLARFEAGCAVLAAPAGYGKTWLAAQVAGRLWSKESRKAPVPLWTIHHDFTVSNALRSLCRMLGREGPLVHSDKDIAPEAALDVLADVCHGIPALIIDMDGAAPSKALQHLVAILLSEFRPQNVLVACRSLWALPIDRMRAGSPLKVFGANDLAFSCEEIAAAQNLTLKEASDWEQASEGWPVLCSSPAWNALSSAQPARKPADRFVNQFADYFEKVLLAPFPQSDIDLLMSLSIFDVIEPGILEGIGLGAPWSRLATLVRMGLPVSRDQTDWDRIVIHRVCRSFLERRMQATLPARYRSLCRSSANYFGAVGRYTEAMRFASKLGDPSLEARITEDCGGWRISLREGLKALGATTEISERFPRAALARIYWLAQTGRIDDAARGLERLHGWNVSRQLGGDLYAMEAVIDVYRDAPFTEERIQVLDSLRKSGDDELMFPSGATLQAAMLNNAALYERAALVSREAISEAETLGSDYIGFYGQLQYALALHGLGRVHEAIIAYGRARELATTIFSEGSDECRVIDLLIANAAWLMGVVDRPEQSVANLDGLYGLHTWFEPYARILQFATSISRLRMERSLEERVIEDFSDLAKRRCLPRLKPLVEAARAQQALAYGQIELAESICDDALKLLTPDLAGNKPATIRVAAPLWLEKARIALRRGSFEDAGHALAWTRSAAAQACDRAARLDGDLLLAYVSLRARQHRDAIHLLTRSVIEAERTGLRRAFLDNASFVLELVDYAKKHALQVDPAVLNKAAGFASPQGSTNADFNGGRPLRARGGLLLTDRETDILNFLAGGLSSKEMARLLKIAEGTVKTHRRHLYEKLGARMRSQAIVKARSLGLL